MEYLKENSDWIDPIVFTTSQKTYTDELLKILDPNKELFQTLLYTNACYLFEIKEENIIYMIKDISRFRNRDIRRSVLLDPRPINYMMTPENCIPCSEYNAEFDTQNSDSTLLLMMDELEEIKDLEDVRPFLKEKYNIRQILKNSKLI